LLAVFVLETLLIIMQLLADWTGLGVSDESNADSDCKLTELFDCKDEKALASALVDCDMFDGEEDDKGLARAPVLTLRIE
jgi:hypothetical protein